MTVPTNTLIASCSSFAPVFLRFLHDNYPLVKQRHPLDGRRKLRLRILEQFWALTPVQRASLSQDTSGIDSTTAPYNTDTDPFDTDDATNPSALGIIVRTDFSDDVAWRRFYSTLLESEKDFTEPEPETNAPADVEMADAVPSTSGAQGEDEDSSSDEDIDELEPLAFFAVYPSDSDQHQHFTSLSNLTSLRLLTDSSVRPSPSPPPPNTDDFIAPKSKSKSRPEQETNRLVDQDGLQEFYTGKTLWIYDSKSNTDGSVRLVSGQGDMYSTASGDSWRARASHITELQVNLSSGAMRIDFGGLDRWDYAERRRNMYEASRGIVFSSEPGWYRDP